MFLTRSAGACSAQKTFGSLPRSLLVRDPRPSIRAQSSLGLMAFFFSSDISSGSRRGLLLRRGLGLRDRRRHGLLEVAARVVLPVALQARGLLGLVHGLASHHSVEVHVVAVELRAV